MEPEHLNPEIDPVELWLRRMPKASRLEDAGFTSAVMARLYFERAGAPRFAWASLCKQLGAVTLFCLLGGVLVAALRLDEAVMDTEFAWTLLSLGMALGALFMLARTGNQLLRTTLNELAHVRRALLELV